MSLLSNFRIKSYDGVQYRIRLFGINVWLSNHCKKSGWFRFFGKGLKWKHESIGLLFSERNGYSKYLKIGKYIIGVL